MKTSISILAVFCLCNIYSQNNIIAAEYFFDTDPGFENGTSLTVTNNNAISESYAISTTTLPEGFHTLYIRIKNSQNKWSLSGRRIFYKSPPIGNNDIVSAEYFIDVDPGVGNATVVAVTQSTSLFETININIPNDLPSGDHFLHLRILNSSGKWSLYARPEFESTLSVNNTAFESLKLYPNPVEDILYVSFKNNSLKRIKLIHITGHMVMEQNSNLEQINLSHLSSGFYLFQIETSEGNISKKILKK